MVRRLLSLRRAAMRSWVVLLWALSASPARAEEVVPGRVVVKLRKALEPLPLPAAVLFTNRSGTEAAPFAEAVGIKTEERATAGSVLRVARRLAARTYLVEISSGANVAATEALALRLAAEPGVEWAEPDRVRRAAAGPVKPNDPMYPSQWALPLVRAPQAWSRAT